MVLIELDEGLSRAAHLMYLPADGWPWICPKAVIVKYSVSKQAKVESVLLTLGKSASRYQ